MFKLHFNKYEERFVLKIEKQLCILLISYYYITKIALCNHWNDDLRGLELKIAICFLADEWKTHQNYCVSEDEEDLKESMHAKGDASFDKCKEECDANAKCSAFAWYANGKNGVKCFLILTKLKAVKGSENPQFLDATCTIKPSK